MSRLHHVLLPVVLTHSLWVYLGAMPLLLLPWVAWTHHGTWFDGARLLNIGLAMVACLALVRRPLPAMREIAGIAAWHWILLGMVLLLASAVQAAHPYWALLDLCMWAGAWALAWAVSGLDEDQRRQLWSAAVFGAALHALASLVVLVVRGSQGWLPGTHELAPGFVNMRLLNHVQTLSMPILAAEIVLSRSSRRRQALLACLLVVHAAVVVQTSARATMVGLVAGALVAMWVGRRHAWRQVLVLTGAAFIGLLLWWGAIWHQWQGGQVSAPGVSIERLGTIERRGELIARALDLVWANPWFGVGPMHYAHLRPGEALPAAASPHNMVVMAWAEWGTLACLVFGVIFSVALFRGLRGCAGAASRQTDPARLWRNLACVAAVMGALVDGQFDGNLLAPLSQTWFVVLLGLWIGAHGDGGGHPPVRMVTGRWRTSVVSALLLTQVGQLALGAPQWLDAATWRQRTPYPAAADGTQKLAPRYWVQGWF